MGGVNCSNCNCNFIEDQSEIKDLTHKYNRGLRENSINMRERNNKNLE